VSGERCRVRSSRAAQCEAVGLLWSADMSFGDFDHIGHAMRLVISTLISSYTTPLAFLSNAPEGPDLMPVPGQSANTAIWFIICLHGVFSFFLMNVFIGTIGVVFSERTGKTLVTGDQHRWSRCSAHVTEFDPELAKVEKYRPSVGCRAYTLRHMAYELVTHALFQNFSLLLIMANTAVLASAHYPTASEYYGPAVVWTNTALLLWFSVELLVTLVAFGFKTFLGDADLTFDGVIIVISVFYRFTGAPSGFELFRIFRAVKLLFSRQANSSIVALMNAVGKCMIKAFDIAFVSFLVSFVFSIIAMQQYGDADLGCGEGVHCYSNFHKWPDAMAFMVQVAGGYGVADLIGNLAADVEHAHLPTFDPVFIFVFFAAYKFVIDFVCINLFIVSVLDNFADLCDCEQDIDFDHFWAFTFCWAELTIGAGAAPSLEKPEAKSFVRSLRDIVKQHDDNEKRVRTASQRSSGRRHSVRMWCAPAQTTTP
jgi:hypothetical protein